jgi:hypothetical protein
MVTPLVNVVKNVNLGSLTDAVGALAKKEVLVGIPAEHSSRQTPSDDNINNAELLYIQSHGVRAVEMREEMQKHIDTGKKYSEAHSLYIQSHGSPLWRIPPRPVLEPSIEANKEPIAKQLQQAVIHSVHNRPQEAEASLHKAGIIAENAAKAWFENPANGWPPNAPATIKAKGSDSPLIDTGEMRKSITHVIREVGSE